MAKKKKRRSRRRSGKKRSAPKKKSKPIGLAGGGAVTAFEMAVSRPPSGISAPIDQLLASRTLTENLKWTLEALKQNAVDTSKYKYALAGVLITASPKIPLVGIVARPVDRGLKRLSKGKWGL